MRSTDLLRFTIGAVRGHGVRTALSLAGVAIGVAAVILLTSLGEGARRYVSQEFETLGAHLLIILPGKTETTGLAPLSSGTAHDLTLDDVEALGRRYPRLFRLAPLAMGRATVRFGSLNRDVMIAGVTSEWAAVRRLDLRLGANLPSAESGADRAVCVIGATVQAELFPGASPIGQMLRIGDERFRVIGVTVARGTSIGMDLDDIVMIPIRRHQRMFNSAALFRLLIDVDPRASLDAARTMTVSLLKERHDDEEDVTVLTQDAMLKAFGNIFTLLSGFLTGIAAISLTVAGVGVMNVMLVSVSERTREIGLLKALGATARQVLALFVLEAVLIAGAGGAAGLGGAWLLTVASTALYPAFPLSPPLWAVLSALAVSAGVGVAFGAWPARRAAALDPVSALSKR